ncbi:MAG: iron-containing alcohol dehydrogenase [Clostridia bacterium]|nr:iron-containing alcohol dehydrogenase [Clostridia bacterium]
MIDMKLPVKLITGENCIINNAGLLENFGRRFLLVTGASSADSCGAVADLDSALLSFGGEYVRYSSIGANPLLSSCREAGILGNAFGAEAVIGIGGGSALDAAKAAAVYAANPSIDEAGFYAKGWPEKPLPIILIGTTSGTGSEITAVSVVTDSKGRKHSISDGLLCASLAFGDYRYTESMNKALTLTTGIDAVAHCIESYVSKKATEESRQAASRGLKLLIPVISAALSGELTSAEREKAYEGSLFGGLAIYHTGTCFPHNVGYYLTETRGIPHGFACAAFLGDLLLHTSEVSPETVRKLEEDSGAGLGELVKLTEDVLKYSDVSAVKLTTEEIDKALPRWETAGAVKNSPGNFGTAEIREILSSSFCDK